MLYTYFVVFQVQFTAHARTHARTHTRTHIYYTRTQLSTHFTRLAYLFIVSSPSSAYSLTFVSFSRYFRNEYTRPASGATENEQKRRRTTGSDGERREATGNEEKRRRATGSEEKRREATESDGKRRRTRRSDGSDGERRSATARNRQSTLHSMTVLVRWTLPTSIECNLE